MGVFCCISVEVNATVVLTAADDGALADASALKADTIATNNTVAASTAN